MVVGAHGRAHRQREAIRVCERAKMSRPTVFVTRRLPDAARELLEASVELREWPESDVVVPRDVLLREVRDVEGLLCMLTDRIDGELVANARRLRAVSTMAVGYDNIDVPALNERGVPQTP